MPLRKYKDIKFNSERLDVIEKAVKLVNQYRKMGYNLTLRQIYYQFVAHDLFPKDWTYTMVGSNKWVRDPDGTTNAPPNYKTLGDIVADARLAGLIDWTAIEDRTREVDGNTHWSSPEAIIEAVSQQFQIDKWADQPKRVEVWVEKDALEGVVAKVARELDVQFFSCRGYASMTSLWDAGQRLRRYAEEGQKPVILHLGDHDPSGIDMSRDIGERVRLFMDGFGDELEFERIALNMPQIKRFRPPPNPAKVTDSRFKKYQEEHGDDSWELDALDPTVIDRLIRDRIKAHRVESKYVELQEQEAMHRDDIGRVAGNWDHIVQKLRDEE